MLRIVREAVLTAHLTASSQPTFDSPTSSTILVTAKSHPPSLDSNYVYCVPSVLFLKQKDPANLWLGLVD